MANQLYRDDVMGRIGAAMLKYKHSQKVKHPGLQGKIREIAVQDLIFPLMPRSISCGNGKIIDADQEQSDEMDVILYGNNVLPPILFDQALGLYPYEACLACIQVKSKISASLWRDTASNLRSLERLKMLPGVTDEDGRGESFINPPTQRALFAFESDLTGKRKTELDRYKSAEPKKQLELRPLNLICVVGQGCWWWDREGDEDSKDYPSIRWNFQPATDSYDEVIKFLTFLRLRVKSCLRGRGEPNLERYLLP